MPNPLLYKELLPKMTNNYIYESHDKYSLLHNGKENILRITKQYYQNLYGQFITPKTNMKPFLNAQIDTFTSENTMDLGEEIKQKFSSLLLFFPANKLTRRISRGQFLALKMSFSILSPNNRIRKFRYIATGTFFIFATKFVRYALHSLRTSACSL